MTDFPPFKLAFEVSMRALLSNEWKEFVKAHETEGPVSIRLNPSKPSPVPARPVPWTAHGYYLDQRPSFTRDPLFHAGAYYVQDASSMFLEQALCQCLDLSQSLRVLDLCAAPGGKSTHILSLINSASLLVTNEVIGSRATILSENIQKWGYPNAIVTNNDPADFQRLPGYFDAILVDAPCSGEGLFRKDASAMQEWSPEAVELCSQRQRRILHDVWPCLKEGGVLIYCTCTYNEKENEGTLDWLQQNANLESLPLQVNPSWHIRRVDHKGLSGYHFFPHCTQGEGFFLAVVRKMQPQSESRTKHKINFPFPSKKVVDELRHWIVHPDSFQFITHGELILLVPQQLRQDMERLSDKLKIVNRGIAVATQKHDKLIPEHALALSTAIDKTKFSEMPLPLEEALAYLRRESIPAKNQDRGFALISFQDTPLGWVNRLGTRMNNLYPTAWRIRHL